MKAFCICGTVLLLATAAACSSSSSGGQAGTQGPETPNGGGEEAGVGAPDGSGGGSEASPLSDAGALLPDGHAEGGHGGPADAGAQPAPGATVKGTLAGQSVATTDTIAILGSYRDPNVAKVTSYLSVTIVDYANECGLERANVQKGSSSQLYFLFSLTNVNDPENPPPIGTGTYAYDVNDVGYPVPDANGNALDISIFYDQSDGTCHLPNGNLFATQGTVTLSAITGNAVVGSFDLAFPNGDHLTGTFDSPRCDVSGVADAGQPSCQP